MKILKAHYKDERHDMDIDIINTEDEYSSEPLSFCIDGITFHGTSFGDFELADDDLYDKAKESFNLLKYGGTTKWTSTDYSYSLQRYSLDVEIPVAVARNKDNSITEGILRLSFEYKESCSVGSRILCDNETVYSDRAEVSEFSLTVDGEKYESDNKDLWTEDALIKICRKIKDDYSLKCCFTCQYSDYSPYGSDDFGLMLCYKNHKSEYLKVNNKSDFLDYVDGLSYETRQETYLCGEYEPRVRCSGYRGFVE